ncbi:nitrite reductase large subunit NirB [Cytobacillus pseudoceanisediminis]|uniref:nitrite reductase large subunit NirB n=1 Tax=Cytobacillus pseudoceanisediminis TaxID=3051614 RepID=UPI003C307960
MMAKEKLVVIGNGMAGVRCVEEIIQHDPDRFSISIFGSEKYLNYNRILLSSVLQGNSSIEHLTIRQLDWYARNHINVFTNETVMDIDIARNTIHTNKNRIVPFDKLIIATGSTPIVPSLPGGSKEGILKFRTIEDCRQIMNASEKGRTAAVIGGGLLGLEAAQGLIQLGMDVHVVHNAERIMNKQLDDKAAKLLQNLLEAQGMNFLLKRETGRFEGKERVEKLIFTDGLELEADLVIIAAGVTPNSKLAKSCGLKTNRGILVNDFMQTSNSAIYAVGECAEHRGKIYGLVKPLYDQCKILAAHICGKDVPPYQGSILSSKLKISGTNVFSAGNLFEKGFTQTMTLYDEDEKTYKKIVYKHNKIAGFLLVGDLNGHVRLMDMMERKKKFSDEEKLFLLNSSREKYPISSMAYTGIVCSCNSVTKKAIIEAVSANGLETAEEVKNCTKASGTCGGCKPLVEDLLSYIKSDEFHEDIEPGTFCSCTNLSEEEVIEEIQLRGLINVTEVFAVLGWRNQNGCGVCVPALHYILRMAVPGYEGDGQSIFYQDTHNAVKEEDGTFTIIPQIYGDEVSGGLLKKIGEAAEQYCIPVALSHDGRILLKGIMQENLAAIWDILNTKLIPIPINNAVRVVLQTGSKGCGCTRDSSRNMAERIQGKSEYLLLPNRLEIVIAACVHGKNSMAVHDVEVKVQEQGWEIYIGGTEAFQLRGELLAIASTEEETEEMLCSLVQYFRESARYQETLKEWTDRMGIIHLREVVFDLELRNILLRRLEKDSSVSRRRLPVTEREPVFINRRI